MSVATLPSAFVTLDYGPWMRGGLPLCILLPALWSAMELTDGGSMYALGSFLTVPAILILWEIRRSILGIFVLEFYSGRKRDGGFFSRVRKLEGRGSGRWPMLCRPHMGPAIGCLATEKRN